MNDNRIMSVFDENGNQKEMRILFAKHIDEFNKNYIFYLDPTSTSGQVFVSSIDEDQQLQTVSNEAEWKALEKVFQEFVYEMQHSSCAHCNSECDCSTPCENCHDCKDEN